MSAVRSISVTELKMHTGRLLRSVAQGRTVTVTHRRKPLARLVPFMNSQSPVSDADPLFRIAELAEPMGVLTNGEIDALVYGG
ncbi:MAG: type II toxin-antitoxin system prevent-host-death family antitoxin [Verrucomicrobia bacterium]|nr:type II toxin-antitoxin system prevent-host-death family antitoxin [Verrucomicrobiota bacterium]